MTTRAAVKDAHTVKDEAAFAVAKEKCDAFSGDTKTTCVRDAKLLYGQP